LTAEYVKPLKSGHVLSFGLIQGQVEEFPAVKSTDIELALKALRDSATTLMFHAEMIPPITDSVGDDVQRANPPLAPTGPLTHYSTFLDSRPPSFETYAIAEILSLAHLAPDLQLHIVHLSAIEAIPLLREARSKGVKITAETCFHYLSLAAEKIKAGDTRHKCCPPIRGQSNQDGLWEELLQDREDGVIKTVVSDHSPCTPNIKLLPAEFAPKKESKRKAGHSSDCDSCESSEGEEELAEEKGDFFSAWGGISSVGLGLPILWTEGTQRYGDDFSIEDVVRWCCKNTAKQVGLERSKGDLAIGFDADIVVFDDTAEFIVSEAAHSGKSILLTVDRSSPVLCSSGTRSRHTRTRLSRALSARLGFAAAKSSLVKTDSLRRLDRLASCCSSPGR
jgi:allantoinase